MKQVAWMIGASVGSAVMAIAWLGAGTAREVLLGMVGPLVAVAITWIVTERAHKENPGRVTALMIKAFAGKIVFFGAYVAIMLTQPWLQPVPFVASFTSYFIALYLFEALCLQRLFAAGTTGSRSSFES